jgi:hypothetical protein
MKKVLVQLIIMENFLSGVEKLVLSTLTSIVEDHIPQLTKERKVLNSLLLDYDASKSRLVSHKAKEGSSSTNSAGLVSISLLFY